MKLNEHNVDAIEKALLDDCEMYGLSAEAARDMLNYICGIHDMANAVRRAIDQLNLRTSLDRLSTNLGE